jgi:methanogenic corrinoid protein MtbC1
LKRLLGKTEAQNLINKTISSEVVPKLVRKIHKQDSDKITSNTSPFDDERVSNFCKLLFNDDSTEAFRRFDTYLAEGYTVTDLFLDLVSKSAIKLGKMWELDDCSFGDVTIGMTVLHQIVRSYTTRLSHELKRKYIPGSIFLSPMPGQNHVFGAFILEAFLSAAGWDINSGFSHTKEDFLQEFSTHEYSIIAISVASDQSIDDCTTLISNIRNMSLNRRVKVIVGGFPFVNNSKLYKQVGADGTAQNALQAIDVVQAILDEESNYV